MKIAEFAAPNKMVDFPSAYNKPLKNATSALFPYKPRTQNARQLWITGNGLKQGLD
jgi:hypothetical protein